MKKKSNNHSNFFKQDCNLKKCDEVNCEKIGEYLAPKSPNSSEKYIFCLEHIKLYNKRWNYFAGKSQQEIYEFQKNDFFEGKPTRPFSKNGSASKIKFQFKFYFDKQNMKFKKKDKTQENNIRSKLNDKIESSLTILGLEADVTEDQLKKKYKSLVKKYHPDVKNNLSNKEIKMKNINKAYKIIQNYVKS